MATAISSPVAVEWYPVQAFFLIAVGLAVTAYFFIYEATSTRKSRKLSTELSAALVASVFLGFGTLFLLLSSGVYV
ncbi:hypothetical protein H6P81_000120 [Aristolochia fimbriata]|uniref:Dolichyl-diphosphooligosaccharide-protein glycosyltransferase subunit OST5 n=1 Tax=Aristolochia fimbriata TaxID=158543 RepID=A0AAV7F752_ARIFI|nr:hypothetical protein H6P81_000120 [Aristolochia fimbriata]